MARSLIFGNGTILVNMDSQGLVRDFYYPYVGQENQTSGDAHRLGVWVDNNFSWLSDPSWQKILTYKKDTLVSAITWKNESLQLEIHSNDLVHHEKNIFLRHVVIRNKAAYKREIRFFFHQAFTINQSPYSDTVYYYPKMHSIIHYKSKCYFLINACLSDQRDRGISSYACGYAGQYGKQGTYIDAEDGILSNNAIEHGEVDSTISLNFFLEGYAFQEICYWICAGKDLKEVSELNAITLSEQSSLQTKTEDYWREWVNRTPFEFKGLSEPAIDLFKRSLLIIRVHMNANGAIIASSDSEALRNARDTYCYMWPRDGALITHSLDRGGYLNLSQKYFRFCNEVITEDGYLFHKYLPNKSWGSTWHSWLHDGKIQLPFQEDETAVVLYALLKHYQLYGDKDFIKELFESLIVKVTDFMLSYIDEATGLPKASYDLWEEKLGIHTYTCCSIYAGLVAASQFEEEFGTKKRSKDIAAAAESIKNAIITHLYDSQEKRFIKGLYYDNNVLKKDITNDASNAFGVFTFEVLPVNDPRVLSTFTALKNDLAILTPIGGYARYKHDRYFQVDSNLPGNPWFITTLWLAQCYISMAKEEKDFTPALEVFNWVASHASSTGILSEQLNPHTGEQLSVAPLTWSHAAFVTAITQYLEKLDDLEICKICNPIVKRD